MPFFGFAVLVAVFVLGASQAIGAVIARRHFIAIQLLADRLIANPDLTDDDRRSVADELIESAERWSVWIMAFLAPFLSVPFFLAGALDYFRNRGKSEEEIIFESRAEYERLDALLGGRSRPIHSAIYLEARMELAEHGFSALVWKSPLLSLWIGFWLSPSYFAYAAAGAADVAVGRFRLMLEAMPRKMPWHFVRHA